MKQNYMVFSLLIGAVLFFPDEDLWKLLKRGCGFALRALLGRFVGAFLPKV